MEGTFTCLIKMKDIREEKGLIILWLEGKRGEKGSVETNCLYGSTNILFFLLSLQIHKITLIPLKNFDFL